jgi:phosphatidylserine/phosphatidylglycerophosphate/cardiolipin synthase-like enzyme
MRTTHQESGMLVQAVAGTHVVILGWDLIDPQGRKGLLGFAIQRDDQTEGESYWLRGMKTFASSAPLAPGGDASTHEQPLQSFQWGDYSAKPAHRYRYRIVPLYGEPGALQDGDAISVTVHTESEDPKAPHNVYFNRGAVASQEYARRFHNAKPSDIGPAAYTWLSRGLQEALLAFIGEARDDSYGLRVAMYEFQWPEVLQALKAARERKVDVQIIFDAVENAAMAPVSANRAAIQASHIGAICKPFNNGKLMHNKFMVLTHKGLAQSVWTGSTNITENGLFGHLNCGHRVHDQALAQHYLNYWSRLQQDPGSAALKQWTASHSPALAAPPGTGMTQQFSPQTGLATLQQYGATAALATRSLFMTFAFGMHGVFQQVYARGDTVARFALMEKEGNGAGLVQGQRDITALRQRANVFVAVGKNISTNRFDRWLKERSAVVDHAHVNWIHTKFMVVDPFGPDPIVITGSANFSEASVQTNEENMLLIRGDQRVADIYVSEFMRAFTHYAFREAVFNHHQQTGSDQAWEPQKLAPTDRWTVDYFKPGSARSIRRLLFSGQ